MAAVTKLKTRKIIIIIITKKTEITMEIYQDLLGLQVTRDCDLSS